MFRFLLRPRWIGLTLFAVVVVGVCVRLGLWQLDRLEGRRDFNDRYASGLARAPRPLEDLLRDGGALAYRRAIAIGRYDTEHEVILYGRSLDGQAGNHVLTPLVLADGRAVVVDRGWVPFEMDEPPVAGAAPPGETDVEVEGTLFAPQPGGAGEIQAGMDRVTTMRSVDVDAIARDVSYDLVPWFLQLRSQTPGGGDLPVPAPLPELDDGPHLSYAFQWFAFATIAAVGYVILVRHEVADRSATASGSGVGPG
ncbi:MAG TPA: SURF1 family protein [Actinomycetota bacterium]|nr:SURF1 family protein [Actinomycetota bacterium]